MISSTLPSIPGFNVIEILSQGSRTVVYRALQEGNKQPVIIKLLCSDYPKFAELLQFRNQYQITKNLDIPGVSHPISLTPWRNGYALILQDSGGVELGKYIRENILTWQEVLSIALQLANILHNLIPQRIIHKDIKPANILIHPKTKEIRLIDFSIASLLPQEKQELQNPGELEGTLAYLAPEQSGRMNRGIDYRVDFYALGVTLYELLCGELPFSSQDPIELIHCHIAKLPKPPHKLNPQVPAQVSSIILKLMAKNAEDRYQSALGLKHDLQHCLQQWEKAGMIELFELGKHDRCERFLIPEKLYGRKREVQALLDAFGRSAQGCSELMLVAGFSGIGKTAVVNEVHKPITQRKGYFIKGKFDQLNRSIPFSAFVQAFRSLMWQLMGESDAKLEEWKGKILTAIGDNGQLLTEVIPELEKIIGPQPLVSKVTGEAAQIRFNLLFRKFIRVFATQDHPLVIFLDDLQWADLASLHLLNLLVDQSNSNHLLVLGAYRDNEVSLAHPLMLTLEEIEKSGARINTITLNPLSENSLNQLISDTLYSEPNIVKPLTDLVFKKTGGNPFFVTQFLKVLHKEKLVSFSYQAGYWQCNVLQVQRAALTDNIVAFMASQLKKLPDSTLESLKLAACIGAQFDLEMLSTVSQKTSIETATILWQALQESFILPSDQVYKFFQSSEQLNLKSVPNSTYRFLHDRIQQAAYSLIPEDQRSKIHLNIGQLLMQKTPAEKLDEQLFIIVGQLNFGVELVTSKSDCDTIAKLNLNAARKARLSAAYDASAQYCETALHLVIGIYGEQLIWYEKPKFALEIYIESANSAGLIGAYNKVDQYIKIVLQQTNSPLTQSTALEIQIQALISRSRLSEAVQLGIETLRRLNVPLPEQPTSEMLLPALRLIRERLAIISDIANLSTMEAPEKLAAMRILTTMASAAYIGSPELYPLIVLKQVELSLEYGNTVETAYAYATYGLILCAFEQDIEAGNNAADIALSLMDRFQATHLKSKILNLIYPFIRIWKEPVRNTLEPLLEGYQAGLESGDLEFAAYCLHNHCELSYAAGENLFEVQQDHQRYGLEISKLKQKTALNFHQIHHQAVLNWLGEAASPKDLIGSTYDESSRLAKHQEQGDPYSIGSYHVHKLILTYHFGTSQEALEIAKAGKLAVSGILGTAFYSIFSLYHALTLLEVSSNNVVEQDLWKPVINQELERLLQWSNHSSANFGHRCDLIRAEQQRILGQRAAAISLYDRAISAANANHYIQESALANELAAKFYLEWGKEKVAAGYMQEAYYNYSHWGAKAKTEQLVNRYPYLLQPILQETPGFQTPEETLSCVSNSLNTSTHKILWSRNSFTETLDLSKVIHSAQLLSDSLNLETLIAQLIELMLNSSGADSCALAVHKIAKIVDSEETPEFDPDWLVYRRSTNSKNTVSKTSPTTNLDYLSTDSSSFEQLADCHEFPHALFNYVRRTLEVVQINDLEHEKISITDPYLLKQKPKSILARPITYKDKVVAILYLENRNASNIFGKSQREVINFFCNQAGIALENARLFQQQKQYSYQLETKNKELEISKNKAINSDLAKSYFLRNMTHELRTPLNGILGYAQILQRSETLSEVERRGVNTIYQCGDSLLGLVNDIIHITQKETENYEISSNEVNLPHFLNSIIGIAQPQAHAKLNLIYQPNSELPTWVLCDEKRLKQVLLNLLSNSIKFTREGTVILQVKLAKQTKTDVCLEFLVSDTGIGISEQQQEKLFEPFGQVRNSENKSGGLGIGLTISQKLVRRMGGEIKIKSELGKGSSFYFTLELALCNQIVSQIDQGHDKGALVTLVRYGDGLSHVEGEVADELLIPDHEELEELLELIRMGRLQKIHDRLEALLEKDRRYWRFVNPLSTLKQEFKLDEIEALLLQHLQQSDACRQA